MSIDLLDTPLRVTWDLHGPDGRAEPARAVGIAERLVEGGVFFVTLEERPLAHPAYLELASVLKGGGCTVQVRYGSTAAERSALTAGCRADALLLEVAPYLDAGGNCDTTALRAEIETLRRSGLEPSLVLTPTRVNLPLLPRLMALCREAGVGRFKLPNTKVDDSFSRSAGGLLPQPDDLSRLAEALRDAAACRQGLELEIHDLFLWELFFPPGASAGRSEYGGCQAANSLAHVTVDGQVYACSSWPEPLGSLVETSLLEIWAAPRRLALRQAIAAVPTGCAGCRDYQRCFGGCRGLSATLAPNGAGRDLLCAGRRD